MVEFVLDYSWGRPDPSWTKRSGYAGVLRYISDSPGKTGKKLTAEELTSLLDAELAVAAVWQETHDAITGGDEAGKADGAKARTVMEELGAPEGAAVYFCADSDTVTTDHATAYLKAAREALGPYALGLYGGYDVITGVHQALGDDVFLWQTAAWSTDKIAEGAHLYQQAHRASFAGHKVDINTAYRDQWGQFTKTT